MSNHSIALVTDSTCDIPEDLIAQYDIHVIPSYVIWGAEQFRDRVDLQPQEFYQRLVEDPVLPTTACPTPADFLNVYQALVAGGAREIVVITVSSHMSGTLESAQLAGTLIDAPVHAVDSMGPTMSLGWQVLAAARAREAGGDVSAMIAAADAARAGMVQIVCLDTLEYLHKGGRIGNATRLIGTMLNIKPLVYIDHNTGLVEALANVRTHKKALQKLYTAFFEEVASAGKVLRVAVLHGNLLDDANRIAERIWQEFSPAEVLIHITGPVLGLHTGPRALALCGYAE